MAKKTPLSERESAQADLKKRMNGIINGKGLRTAELQVNFLLLNKKTPLPTMLNHKETLRIYQLTIQDYKNKLEKKQQKQQLKNEENNGN